MGNALDVMDKALSALNSGDLDGYINCYADDATLWSPSRRATVRGKGPIQESAEGWFTAFPGLQFKRDEVIEAGDRIVLECTFSGTQTGPWVRQSGTIPATGRHVEVPYVGVFQVRDGKIVAERSYFDVLGIMTQLGLIPVATSTT